MQQASGRNAQLVASLDIYVAMLRKWNGTINLVSRQSLADVWGRHIDDSLQVFDAAPAAAQLWVDLGSGGGLPGVVAAAASASLGRSCRFVLIESDQRKAAFLRNVSRETGVKFEVMAKRIEGVAPQGADVVSARALAPLDVLCGYAMRHLLPNGTGIFPKGAAADLEVAEARQKWDFDLTEIPSRTDSDARLLLVRGLRFV